jgi:hypothetical protein
VIYIKELRICFALLLECILTVSKVVTLFNFKIIRFFGFTIHVSEGRQISEKGANLAQEDQISRGGGGGGGGFL